MRKRLLYWFATVLLAISVVLVVWEAAVRVRSTNPTQTFIFWAMSILTFVVMVTLGWVVFRTGVKLYMERQANREGSRIRSIQTRNIPAMLRLGDDVEVPHKRDH